MIATRALYPYLKVTSKRSYFTSNQLRATIDTNLQYIGFYGTKRSKPLLIGEDETARLELKAHSPVTIDSVLQKLIFSGVHLSDVQECRKDHLQRLYFTAKDRLKAQDDVINEAPNYEIEAKLLVDGTIEISLVYGRSGSRGYSFQGNFQTSLIQKV